MGRGALTGVVVQISRNHALTRLLIAYALLVIAECGEWLALIIYAYARGGASAAAVVAIVQLIPSMLLGPVITAHLSRLGAARLLRLAYAASAATLALCSAAILADASVVVVYGTAITFGLALSVARAMHPALLPRVVRHPDELTAANVATSWCEATGTLVGPGGHGRVRQPQRSRPGLRGARRAAAGHASAGRRPPSRRRRAGRGADAGALGELLAAARVIAARPSTRSLIAFPVSSAVIEGAIDLLVVVLAVRVLTLGSGAAGYLSAAFGTGGLVGGLAAIVLVGRRLATPLMTAALVGALALGALALSSTVIVAVVLLASSAAHGRCRRSLRRRCSSAPRPWRWWCARSR